MIWQLAYSARAERDIEALDTPVARRIIQALERLAATHRGQMKQLRGTENELRLRVGDWRVRLILDARRQTVYVLRVRHRREAYRQ